MMKALVKKELLELRFLFGALFVLVAGQILWASFESHSLGQPSKWAHDILDDGMWTGGLFMFAAATTSVAREFRFGTIQFIDGLPASRNKVFAAKVVAQFLLLVLLVVALLSPLVFKLMVAGPHAIIGTAPILSIACIATVVLLAHLGLGFALSWTGSLAWLIFAVGFISVVLLARIEPGLNKFGPEALELTLARADLVLPKPALLLWSCVGILGVVVAGWLFHAPDDVYARLSGLASQRLGRWAMGVVAGLVCVAGALHFLANVDRYQERFKATRSTKDTENFVFFYADKDRAQALALMAVADDIDKKVQAHFKDLSRPRLVVEFADAGRFHAGDFLGNKIRIAPASNERTVSVFAHELAHAYTFLLAKGRLLGFRRFFTEGLAEWVGLAVADDQEGRRASEAKAKRIAAEGHESLDDLLDSTSHRKKYDQFEVYPLGLVFVDALVATSGKDAPQCLMRAIGTVEPEPRSARELWHRISQMCGVDLRDVAREYETRVRPDFREGSRDRIHLVGQVRAGDDGPRVEVRGAHASVGKFVCRFRPQGNDDPSFYDDEDVIHLDGACIVPSERILDERLSFQIGVTEPDGVQFGPWITRPWPKTPVCENLSCAEAKGPLPKWPATVSTDPGDYRKWPTNWRHFIDFVDASFSPDGRAVATVGSDGTIRIWDVRDQSLLDVYPAPTHPEHIEYSPDGRWLVAVGMDSAELRDARSGELERAFIGYAVHAAFSPTHSLLLVASGTRLQIINLEDLEPVATRSLNDPVHHWAVHPDGRHVLIANENTLTRLDLMLGTERGAETTKSQITSLSISADGTRYAHGEINDEAEIHAWDSPHIANQQLSSNDVRAIRYESGFSKRSRRLARAAGWGDDREKDLPKTAFGARSLFRIGEDKVGIVANLSLVVFDPTTCAAEVVQTLPRRSSVDATPDGRQLVVANRKGLLELRHFATQRVSAQAKDEKNDYESVRVSSDATRAYALTDKEIFEWDFRGAPRRVDRAYDGVRAFVEAEGRAFWASEHFLQSAHRGRDGVLEEGWRAQTKGISNAYWTLAITPGGRHLYAGTSDRVFVLDAHTGEELATIMNTLEPRLWIRPMVAGDRKLWMFDDRGTVYEANAFDGVTPTSTKRIQRLHFRNPDGVVFLPKLGVLVSNTIDGLLTVFRPESRELLCVGVFDDAANFVPLPPSLVRESLER